MTFYDYDFIVLISILYDFNILFITALFVKLEYSIYHIKGKLSNLNTVYII